MKAVTVRTFWQVTSLTIARVVEPGDDIYEPESGSFYNLLEAAAVVELVIKLHKSVNDEKLQISYTDIGVIAPYRKQVGVRYCLYSSLV